MRYVHNSALNAYWYPVAENADVGVDPLPVTLLGDRFVLWRTDVGVSAARDRCPHREMPLSMGCVDESQNLRCAYHGWGFDAAGLCVDVPSSGPGVPAPPTARLHGCHVQERYGLIWLCPGVPVADLPVIVHDADPSFRRINTGVEIWNASATRMVDNFLDISHFPWVHTGTFGSSQATGVASIELVDLDGDFHGYAYEVDASNPEEAAATTGSAEPVVHRRMSTGFALPLLVRSTIAYEDGLEHILLLCSTPVDDETSLFTFVVWRNDNFSVDAEETIAFDRAIGAEDKSMLEQVPGPLPLGRTAMVSVQADKPSVEWRRRFFALLDVPE